MIEARVIADSINQDGNRLTTFLVTMHRIVLAQLNTHRLFTRNASSSRAIPTDRFIKQIMENPALPVYWGKNQKGMQPGDEVENIDLCIAEWLGARDDMIKRAEKLKEYGVHKQTVNRLFEPFMYTTVLISATELDNFFKLRLHKDAQDEIQVAARAMHEALQASTPKQLRWGDWHIPFADQYMRDDMKVLEKVKIATARCARTSYLNFDGNIDYQKDFKLHDDLIGDGHLSPTEHCAMADPEPELHVGWAITSGLVNRFKYCSNFKGFIQYRKMLEQERTCEK